MPAVEGADGEVCIGPLFARHGAPGRPGRKVGLRAHADGRCIREIDLGEPAGGVAVDQDVGSGESGAGMALGGNVRDARRFGIEAGQIEEADWGGSGVFSREVERLVEDVAGGAGGVAGDGASAAEQGIEESGLAGVGRADESHGRERPVRLAGRIAAGVRADPIGQVGQGGREVGGGNGDNVLLIGEVDTCLDEGKKVGEAVGPGAVKIARLAREQSRGGREVGVAVGGNHGGDALGLLEREAVGEVGPGGELARVGLAGTGIQTEAEDALDQVRVAGEKNLGGVLAGVAAWGAEVKEGDREGRACRCEAEAGPGRGGGMGERQSGGVGEVGEDSWDFGPGEADDGAGGPACGRGDGGDGVVGLHAGLFTCELPRVVRTDRLGMPTLMRDQSFEMTPQTGERSGAGAPAVWPIEPGLTMLNHGSYGVTPEYVRRKQSELRARMDADPVRFFKVELEGLCDRVRRALAAFVGCEAEGIALVPNATFAVATVLHSIEFSAGDEIVVTDQEYNATLNELRRICGRTGAVLRWARLPLPLPGPGAVVDSVMGVMTDRTRLVVVSQIASATGLVFPVEEIVRACRARGVEVLVDGAHAPGQVAVDLAGMEPTYYTGSCHKWLNTPKGSGFIYAGSSVRDGIKPLALSCRVHQTRADRAAFLCDFDYVGTGDYTANLVIPDAIEHMGAQHPGGWGGLMARNHALVVEGAALIRERCGLVATAPDTMFGSMYGLMLPADPSPGRELVYEDPIWDALRGRHGVQAPVWDLEPAGARILRISAQLYNSIGDYERLAVALSAELEAERALRRS